MDTHEDRSRSQTSRREFLRTATAGAFALGSAVWLAGLEACNKADNGVGPSPLTGQKVTLTLSNEPALQSVGGFIRRVFGNNNGGNEVLVIRLAASGSNAFKTMSVICTHAGCPVNNPSGGQVFCGCHGSTFGAQAGDFGSNLSGPAPSPLQTFQTSFDGSIITVSF
jgi:Rieske Fe-S protein